MTATNADDASYVIQTGAAARDRLELIARLLWPTTESFLERAGAFDVTRFVDVGCGIGDVASRVAERDVGDVTGIDVNAVLLRDLGATDIDVEIVQPVLRVPADLQIHARTMEAIAAPIIEQGLATQADVSEIVADLDRFAATPGVFATLPRLIQVSARAPRV
jgi:ubiquinone/menaquinone biosynthesis C-methylase UbiE